MEKQCKKLWCCVKRKYEKGIATLLLSNDNSGRLEMMDFTKN